jgi:hypothetical protein
MNIQSYRDRLVGRVRQTLKIQAAGKMSGSHNDAIRMRILLQEAAISLLLDIGIDHADFQEPSVFWEHGPEIQVPVSSGHKGELRSLQLTPVRSLHLRMESKSHRLAGRSGRKACSPAAVGIAAQVLARGTPKEVMRTSIVAVICTIFAKQRLNLDRWVHFPATLNSESGPFSTTFRPQRNPSSQAL